MEFPRILAGRFWAYVGTIGGVAVSASANYVETTTNGNVPVLMQVPAAGLMALLPVGLFVALEVLVRNRIKEHLWWWRGGMLITALAFAVPSYSHMHDLLVDWGQNAAISYLTPFGWDGLMLLSTLALLLDPDKTADILDRPMSRYEYIVAIPDLPVITRTIVLPGRKPIEIEQAVKSTPIDTVTAKVRKPRKAAKTGGVRFNRPEDHPLFEQWRRAEGTENAWSDEEFARRSGKTPGAARAQAGRWRKHIEGKPVVNGSQMELIKT